MGEQRVALRLGDRGEGADRALEGFRRALPGATVGRADETGSFEVELEASSREEALERVWDAIGASGADDHIVSLEHPDLPSHWRREGLGNVEAPGNRRRRDELLRLLKGSPQPQVSIEALAAQMGVSPAEAEQLVEELLRAGLLRRNGQRLVVVQERIVPDSPPNP